MTMAVTATARRPLPWLELRQWRVGEVKEVMDERCARAIAQWHGGGGVRARRSCGSDGYVAVPLGRGEGEGEAERSKRERVRWEGALLPF